MQVKGVRLYAKDDIRLEEFELPEIKDDEILVKVMSDSICMSTWKMVKQGADHKRVPADVADHPTGEEPVEKIVAQRYQAALPQLIQCRAQGFPHRQGGIPHEPPGRAPGQDGVGVVAAQIFPQAVQNSPDGLHRAPGLFHGRIGLLWGTALFAAAGRALAARRTFAGRGRGRVAHPDDLVKPGQAAHRPGAAFGSSGGGLLDLVQPGRRLDRSAAPAQLPGQGVQFGQGRVQGTGMRSLQSIQMY